MSMVFPPNPPTTLPVTGQDSRFPVRRVYCVGRNYTDHALEMNSDPKEPPFFFTKPADAVVPPNHPIYYPVKTNELHHEVELVVALERGGINLNTKEASHCIFGYAVGLDLTRRDLQRDAKDKSRPWCTAKAFDHSAVVGPISTKRDCGHKTEGDIKLSVNGEIRQHGKLEDMVWKTVDIIVELSQYFELQPGDLIFTGTPKGVGPLIPGDRLEASIDGLEKLTNKVVTGRRRM
ncbi:fumarylacetoacetate hydrolase family protein [Marinibactrum halimedae]|uniref:Fumarylacetoacetate hydrolase n=1 Tax=Marinibactrum halimedae TaxID=1444977 RepID=A0AA37T7Q0_9GAMM|nr:fumarylacetoacetate hydrolase family protein [Marinibactrum halimedae]MCD9460588.1 fumarylacetoacetate hydrolase family protein [Marinibactrum halimedae]GLS27219.1 fumarylacetoacetate hydrolase [Marinibactrum halimedae]